MFYLYLITTALGNYVGVSKNIQRRFKSHRTGRFPIGDALRYDNDALSQILVVGSRSYVYELEAQAISLFETRWPNGFNVATGGHGCRDHLPHIRARMSAKARDPNRQAALVARNGTPEFRAKISAGLMGRTFSSETLRRMSEAHIGHKHSEAHLAKQAASMRATLAAKRTTGWLPPNLGKSLSAETKAKLSVSAKAAGRRPPSCLGRVMSADTRKKISKANKGTKPSAAAVAASVLARKGKPSPLLGRPSPLRGKKLAPENIAKRTATRAMKLELGARI